MLTPEVTGELDLRQPARQSGTLLHNRKLGEAGNRRRALRLGAELTRATVALGEPTERRARDQDECASLVRDDSSGSLSQRRRTLTPGWMRSLPHGPARKAMCTVGRGRTVSGAGRCDAPASAYNLRIAQWGSGSPPALPKERLRTLGHHNR